MREPHSQPLAFPTSSMRAGHICRRPGLVDEHEPLRVKIELVFEPALPFFLDIRTALLYRMASLFFARLVVPNQKSVQGRLARSDALARKSITKLEQRPIPVLPEPGH